MTCLAANSKDSPNRRADLPVPQAMPGGVVKCRSFFQTQLTSLPTQLTSLPTQVTSLPTQLTSHPTQLTSLPTQLTRLVEHSHRVGGK